MKIQLFFVFVIIALGYTAEQSQYYCGRHLSEALEVICEGRYLLAKKSTSPAAMNAVETHTYKGWPWMREHKALALTGSRGKREGIATECCENPCTIAELFSYCAI